MKKFQIVLADPPWEYRDKASAGERGSSYKYPILDIEEIKALPVKKIIDRNCALFLWCPPPHMNICIDVMNAWGFKFVTKAFCWVKRNKKSDSWFWGLGHYTRANTEDCWLGMRGRLERKSASVHQVFDDAVMKHSEKPKGVRDRIVGLFGDLPRIELFATERDKGWVSLGLEIDGRDIRDSIRDYMK